MIQRTIPSSGEKIPAIGLGTWQTFDVKNAADHPGLASVLDEMYTAGGRVIDSSPMYGRSEAVVGELTAQQEHANNFFYATKVWTTGRNEGIRQMETSMQLMKRNTMDLIQVHNLVDLPVQMDTLRNWKQEGRIRYTGVTHYLDSEHAELEKLIRKEKPDFVQFNYSIFSRNAEKRLLPAAAEVGVATLINRPLGQGRLFATFKNRSIPEWATAAGINSWAAFFLAYILADPAVTCAIPATGDPAHARDDFRAGSIVIDEKMRKKMSSFIDSI